MRKQASANNDRKTYLLLLTFTPDCYYNDITDRFRICFKMQKS